jgi:hypothetical protein
MKCDTFTRHPKPSKQVSRLCKLRRNRYTRPKVPSSKPSILSSQNESSMLSFLRSISISLIILLCLSDGRASDLTKSRLDLTNSRLDLTNYGVQLDHVTYLTRDLDSCVRALQRRGYTVTPGDGQSLDLHRHFINFPDGTYIELQGTTSQDTADWRVRSLARYGDHIASVAFRTKDLSGLRSKLTASGISLGEVLDEMYQGELVWRAFGVRDVQPLDIVFIERYQELIDIGIQHENGHRRIEWIIFATEEEAPLRTLFSSLELTKRHEGWFDYWMIGPPERRLNVRIGPPYSALFKRLGGTYVEENGIVIAY